MAWWKSTQTTEIKTKILKVMHMYVDISQLWAALKLSLMSFPVNLRISYGSGLIYSGLNKMVRILYT